MYINTHVRFHFHCKPSCFFFSSDHTPTDSINELALLWNYNILGFLIVTYSGREINTILAVVIIVVVIQGVPAVVKITINIRIHTVIRKSSC